ncbi:diguanylate cyclase [Clostridium frigoris]|uniref:Diguanylate cyclase n=1 Tax=Clostridium frigoris TaxID=205327 RepID=A0ABS6BUT1_9CLOT|nr:diguanylate cyclase [Clostridium frigoris]MBU3159744.1 diguanylate cyclase [Clostridium frigoris]
MNINKIKKSLNNLGSIITVFLFLIICITLIINFVLNDIFISKYFTNIEKEQVISKTEQSSKILQTKVSEIERLVGDYALWDETYNKVQDVNIDKNWFSDNYTKWLPQKYGVDLIVILNRNKKLIAQHGLNNLNDILNDNKIMGSLNKDEFNENSRVTGFKKYNGELYMISECPIFKNTSAGICHGIVIIGKKISSTFIAKIKEEFGSDIFVSYDNKFVSAVQLNKYINKNIAIINKNKNNTIYNLDKLNVIGNLPITDISGNKIGYINIIHSREYFLSTQKLIQRNTLIAMLLSVIIISLLGWRFKNIIIKPIKSLENQIKRMEDKNLLIHADVIGPEEITSLTKSFNNMIDSIYEHKKENEVLKIYSNTDYLTSVYNHKYFYESFNKKINEGHKQISIMFCDIDKFKLINDSYGHEVGDLILREIAKTMKVVVKDTGMVFRYGGEEFVIILCDYTSEEALIEADEIRKSIIKNQLLQEYSDLHPITISIGIASYPNNSLDAAGLIKKSDTAMYYSKQNGRNQCNIYNNNMKVFLKD